MVHGIRAVQQKTKEDWNETDIHRALVSGRARLFMHPDGFVILERCAESFTQKPYLNVWIAWFKPMKAQAIRPQFIAWLDAITAELRCYTHKFDSPRGWNRLVHDDYEVERVIYRRKKK